MEMYKAGFSKHFSTTNCKSSTVDLILSIPQVAQHLERKTLKDLYDSDHFPIKTYGDNITISPQHKITTNQNGK